MAEPIYNKVGEITNAGILTYDLVLGERVICPACNEYAFECWPWGWDSHAAHTCSVLEGSPEERKRNYRSRYAALFNDAPRANVVSAVESLETALKNYVHRFRKLRQGVTKYGPAPHKPVLLLAVLCGMEEGWIIGNRIELLPELVGAFKSIWQNLVTTGHSPLIAQPFFYMRSEKFWHHVPNPGYENWVQVTKNCQSIGVLHQAVAYAQLDPELYMLAMSPAHRTILKQTLLETYFPNAQANTAHAYNYWDQVTNQMLSESSAEYQAEIRLLQESLDMDSFEEEVFVRGGVFKRQVPLVYNNTCCISGLRVETSVNASLIDACHIVPFSQSHDDTISNGLALCPTLHRAFDRGLVAIDPGNYSVLVSKRLSEPVASTYSIQQFAGQTIRLPDDIRYFPSHENLQAHLSRYAEHF